MHRLVIDEIEAPPDSLGYRNVPRGPKRKALIITGPPGSGKSCRAVEEAEKLGAHEVISWDQFVAGAFQPYLAYSPAALIVEEVPPTDTWTLKEAAVVEYYLHSPSLVCELQGKDPTVVPVPKLILTVCAEPRRAGKLFDIISLHAVLARGPKRKGDRARTEVNSQRYTAAEMQAIERAADGKAADFIRAAAVRSARRKQCPK